MSVFFESAKDMGLNFPQSSSIEHAKFVSTRRIKVFTHQDPELHSVHQHQTRVTTEKHCGLNCLVRTIRLDSGGGKAQQNLSCYC